MILTVEKRSNRCVTKGLGGCEVVQKRVSFGAFTRSFQDSANAQRNPNLQNMSESGNIDD